jgi:RNA polymerase sigma-70 factor (ECF subfamily)
VAALRPRLVAFAYSLTRDREEAADLAQETMARALGAAWRFTPGTNLKAWLFRILRNLHLNRARQAARMPAAMSVEELPVELAAAGRALRSAEHEAALKADLAEVVAALRSLPAAFAIPLQLTAIEELSYAETAEVLGIPVGTVMSRVHRGRRLLLARLAVDVR